MFSFFVQILADAVWEFVGEHVIPISVRINHNDIIISNIIVNMHFRHTRVISCRAHLIREVELYLLLLTPEIQFKLSPLLHMKQRVP